MIPIPNFISERLSQHIFNQCPSAEAGWEFGNQDEDTLTGDFFGNLRTSWKSINNFEWRFHYNKVRGRGPNALENKVGADGIITLHYRNQLTHTDFYKSLVFQAKKEGNSIDYDQWNKMKDFFPGGNIIVNYGPKGYHAIKSGVKQKEKLCKIIATDFLMCKIGIEGLYYNHQENKFFRPTNIPIAGTIKDELMIEVFQNP